MSEKRDLTRRLTEFFAAEAPSRAPDWVLRDSLAAIETTQQRRVVVHLPRRFQLMSTNLKLAAAAVAVVALGVAAFQLLPGTGGTGGEPTPTPTITPTVAPTVAPTPTPGPTAPPLTGAHTSPLYGLNLSYPDGWSVTSTGTEPWTLHALPGWGSPLETGDYIGYPAAREELFILVSSHVLDLNESGSDWADAVNAQPDPGACTVFDPVVVAGLEGRIYGCDEPLRALFWSADRGYLVAIHRSDDLPWAAGVFDRAWLNALLDTVALQ